jgi:hypothetical protein
MQAKKHLCKNGSKFCTPKSKIKKSNFESNYLKMVFWTTASLKIEQHYEDDLIEFGYPPLGVNQTKL